MGTVYRWLLFGLSGVLLGCAAAAPDQQALPTDLFSASYSGVYDAPIILEQGSYEGEPFVSGAASRPRARLAHSPWLAADLDGDGADEYVVVVNASAGGSGTFAYLAVMKPLADGYDNLATVLVGDRVEIAQLAFENGLLSARVSAYQAGERMPPQLRRWRFRDGSLAELQEIAGELTLGHEVREFRRCNDAEPLWVRDASSGELAGVVQSFTLPPYQPLFLLVTGAVGPAPDAEFARPYRSQLEIFEVLRAESEGFGCRLDLDGAVLRAVGVEPFWRVDVKAAVLELLRPGEEPRPFRRAGAEDAGLPIRGIDDAGAELTLEVQPASCRDPMSGALYRYRADLSLDGQRFSGCALGPLPDR